jgi:hypothetical protein
MCDNPPVALGQAAPKYTMSSSRKKVIVRRFAGDTVPGYLPISGIVRGIGATQVVDLLDLTGRILEISLKEVKTISYVRDFNLGDTVNPERMTRRAFLARPRNEGVWVRITFRSGDLIEGLAAADISFMDALIEDAGLHMAPPDIRSNTQRIFVPRSAIVDLQLLAVITNPSRTKPVPKQTQEQLRKELQESLFQAPTPPNTRPN